MKHIKLFEDFNWDEYAQDRHLVEVLIPKTITILNDLKVDSNDTAWFIWDFTKGAWRLQKAREAGKEKILDLLNTAANHIDSIERYIGPRPFGTMKLNVNKRSLLDRLLGRNKPIGYSREDDSVIGQIISLVAKDEKIKQELSDKNLDNLATELWKTHPNNPDNMVHDEDDQIDKILQVFKDMDDADKRKLKGVDPNFWTIYQKDLDDINLEYGTEQAKKKIEWLKKRTDEAKTEINNILRDVPADVLERINQIMKEDIYSHIDQAMNALRNI